MGWYVYRFRRRVVYDWLPTGANVCNKKIKRQEKDSIMQ